jgi:hypothetical protein
MGDYSFLDDAHSKLDFPKFICNWETTKPLTCTEICTYYKDGYCINSKFCNHKIKVKEEFDFDGEKGVWFKVGVKKMSVDLLISIFDLKIEVIK